AFPFPDRVSVPRRRRRLGRKLAAIRPDIAPRASPLEELDHFIWCLNEFNRPGEKEQAWDAGRIALSRRIISQRRRYGSPPADRFLPMRRGIGATQFASIGWLVTLELLLARHGHRRHLVVVAAVAAGPKPNPVE